MKVKHQQALDRERELKLEKKAYRAGNVAMLCIAMVAIALLCLAAKDFKSDENVQITIQKKP